MARARNIKPGIMVNEDLAELPALERLLFVYLWMLADKAGRLEDRPKRIKTQALPYDDVDVDVMLSSLEAAGFLSRYISKGVACIQITNFSKHQSPHHTEKPSDLPEEKMPSGSEGCEVTVSSPLNHREATVRERPDLLIPDSLIPDSLNTDSQEKDNVACAPSSYDLAAGLNGHKRKHDLDGRGLGDTPQEQWRNSTDVYRASRIIEYLNDCRGDMLQRLGQNTGRGFSARAPDGKPTSHAKLVTALIKAGYAWEDFAAVIDHKVNEWGNDSKMRQHLTPATLFARSNFEKYVAVAVPTNV